MENQQVYILILLHSMTNKIYRCITIYFAMAFREGIDMFTLRDNDYLFRFASFCKQSFTMLPGNNVIRRPVKQKQWDRGDAADVSIRTIAIVE